MKPSRKIQIWKTITWTLISLTITTLVGWAITGSIIIGFSVGILDRGAKMFLYFLHENIWHKRYKELKRQSNG